MEKTRIGIICPSEIAFRRFMPAVTKCSGAEYIGVAYASAEEWFINSKSVDNSVIENEKQKALKFKETYGGKVFSSYKELIKSGEVDAVYLPLPPALHYRWAKESLNYGKHIFLEKPSATSFIDTADLINIAKEKNLAVHENYMFVFHSQLTELNDIAKSGKIGDVRLYRIAFGFPQRDRNDFRYNSALGGGALLDCGGYTLKLASMLLGASAKIVYSKLNYTSEFDVDVYGSAAMINDSGVTAQIAFGMDNSYKCELEIWGSKGFLRTGRILTAPDGFEPKAEITVGNETETVKLSADDTFGKSIRYFCECVNNKKTRENNYNKILKQAELVNEVKGNNYGKVKNYRA